MMMSQSKNVLQLVWHLRYIDTAVEGSELYFYNTEGNRNSVVSQALCKMDVTRLQQRAYMKIAVLQGRNVKRMVSLKLWGTMPFPLMFIIVYINLQL